MIYNILMTPFLVFAAIFAAMFLFFMMMIAHCTYLIQQAEVVVIERLGKFHRILKPGLHFLVPFIDSTRRISWTYFKEDPRGKGSLFRLVRMVERIDLRESVYDFPKQNVITKDNVTMEINALLYYQITDPRSAVYEVYNLPQAIEKLTQTTLRNIIGSMDLDECLTSRDSVNERLRIILDDATDKWGVKVNRVELQEVNPPRDIIGAMEKQMRAERDRRAAILEAEGQKQASILRAQGDKESDILEAEGEKLAAIARAEGDSTARRLMATAEAEAIVAIKKAAPESSDPLQYLIALNYIKALPEVTKGKNDKLILMPYEMSGLMSSVAGIKELFKQK
ncbi:SPFH/Band 7/PHB domain protein [Candidatus Babeliales bacterium]|nr:SPFH/Band 7/PHB domain protein [Candidatus Babeliales bacterium]